MQISKLMVVGAGQMGTGIAQVCIQSGFEVVLHDVKSDILEKARTQIRDGLTRAVARQEMTELEIETSLSRLQTSVDLAESSTCDLIVEAIIEDVTMKKDLFKKLDHMMPTHALLASNTSSLSITEMAAVTKRPDKVIGMHFMNPVPVMELVEMIRGLQTSDLTYKTIATFANQLGKTTVEVKDFPGFVSNRVLMPMINEAIYTVYEGVATPQDIDTVMKLGMNHPMGPLTLADFIGLDTCLAVMEILHKGFGDSKYRPCPLLRQYVKAGWLGKKSGRGFFEYT